jgi:DNA-binding response OmpR family regulator
MRILIVEDEPRVGQFIERGLAQVAYTPTWVRTCQDAEGALADDGPFDAVILDLGLPDGDGLKLLRGWRETGFNEPVLILSARDAVQDRIKGLNLGADDYLAKPFSFEELLARVRSLLRRQGGKKATVFEHRGLKLDLLARRVQRNGEVIELTAREFALLELFMQNPGRVLTRTLIAEKVWDSYYDSDTNLLDVYMRRLRIKLETAADKPWFKTLRGVGYQLI